MKKYTNKILLGVIILAALFLVIGVTIDFQMKYHKDPAQFKTKSYPYEYEESSYLITVEDDSDGTNSNE